MENFICYTCEKVMIIDNEYTYRCQNCNLFRSNLKAGVGREIEGVDRIREINSKKIINQILKTQKGKNFEILEIGSGKGTFVKLCEDQEINITGSEADEDQYQDLKKKYKNILKVSLPLKNADQNKE